MKRVTTELYNICIGNLPPDNIGSILSFFPNIANQESEDNDSTFPLLTAIGYRAPIAVVQALIDAWPQGRHYCVLHMICKKIDVPTDRRASIEVAEALITAWPDTVWTSDDDNYFPIHYAASCASLELIELLLKSWPAGILARNASQQLPLHFACQYGRSMPILEYLLHAWPDGAMAIDNYNNTVLNDLVRSSISIPLASVKLIVEAWPGALKVLNKDENLPLHIALTRTNGNARYDIVEYLVDAWPAAIEVRNMHDLLPVDYAPFYNMPSARGTRTDILRLLTGGTLPPLHFACTHGSHLSTIQYIVGHLTNNAVSEPFDGMLALHQACRRAKSTLETVKFLTDSHPQAVEMPMERTGQLPLHLACQNGLKASIVHHLADLYPAAATLPDHKGYYALHYACIGNYCGDDVLHRLAQQYPRGVITAVAPSGGCLPFHLAVLNVETSLTAIYSLLRMYPEECLYPMGKNK